MHRSAQDIALHSALFRDAASEAMREALAACPRRRLHAREPLLTPGQPNRTLYLLLSGSMQVTLAPRPCQKRLTLSRAFLSVFAVGVITQSRPRKRSGSEAEKPERSVPAMGWAPTKGFRDGSALSASLTTGPLTLPTSLTMAPAFK